MQIIPLHIDKEIEPSDDISKLILMSSDLRDGDILVVAQKIISKQEGRIVDLSTVKPSLLSEGLSSQYQKDSRIIELILSETKRIVRMKNGIIIVETNNGTICANAGVDESNVKEGYATLLPINPEIPIAQLVCPILKGRPNVSEIITATFLFVCSWILLRIVCAEISELIGSKVA